MRLFPKSNYFHKVYNLYGILMAWVYLYQHLTYFSFVLVPKPKACRATGRGLQSKGMRVGQLAEFKVDTCKAGPGNLEVLIKDPSEYINSPQFI